MNRTVTPSQARLIRMAMLSGLLLFGVVAAFVAMGGEKGLAFTRQGPLPMIVALLTIGAAGAVMFFRRRMEGVGDFQSRFRMMLIAHALAEAAALVGGAHLIMTGGTLPYVAGLTVFIFSLILLPVEAN